MCAMMKPHAKTRIYLSSPHMSGEELVLVQDAFATNWIAPLGPHVDAFEKEFAERIGRTAAGSAGLEGCVMGAPASIRMDLREIASGIWSCRG